MFVCYVYFNTIKKSRENKFLGIGNYSVMSLGSERNVILTL